MGGDFSTASFRTQSVQIGVDILVTSPPEGCAIVLISLDVRQWFPTGGSRRSDCGVMNSSLESLLKSQFFRTAHTNILCYISKIETRTDFCEVRIISILIPI